MFLVAKMAECLKNPKFTALFNNFLFIWIESK